MCVCVCVMDGCFFVEFSLLDQTFFDRSSSILDHRGEKERRERERES